MRVQGYDGQLLEIERSTFGAPGTPADEDLLLNVTVQVGGYSAADQSWVVAGDWSRFLSQLRQLERLRQGQATLDGASPHALQIVFGATDRAGHMAVAGHVGWVTADRFAQKLEFGFAFDAGMLPTLIREIESLAR